jgi:hypothetical protein
MDPKLAEFHRDLFGPLMQASDGNDAALRDQFFDIFTSYIIDAGEIEAADRVDYIAPRGVRVDGYAGDPADNANTLTLLILDISTVDELETLTQGDLETIFKRLQNFLARAMDETFRESLVETGAAFGLAQLISVRWPTIEKIRLILLSNRRLSNRVDGMHVGSVQGRAVTYSVWDIGRLQRYVMSGREREPIDIDLVVEFGAGIQALPASIEGAAYEGYLAVVPGAMLGRIYDKYETRLLEQNVRVYLQGRGKVNKGIRQTLEHEPGMFFAYNNGLSATAEAVRTKSAGGALQIVGISNLQIVNGGQTTASIHAALRRKTDLSGVFVQMKISIVPDTRANEVVPSISRYANSQNLIYEADFFATHPFHQRIVGFSRRLLAGSADHGVTDTRWYYERARGQYAEERSRLTPIEQRRFDATYPRRQVFTKTDLAKYENVWLGKPHMVVRGAQKNLADYATTVADLWERHTEEVNEAWYRRTIARAIVFRTTERVVQEQDWYEGGYRAAVVAYTIAKLAIDLEQRDLAIDVERIWRQQRISRAFEDALALAATEMVDVVRDAPATRKSITEWAKQEDCWDLARRQTVRWPQTFLDELVGRKQSPAPPPPDPQHLVVEIEPFTWQCILHWGRERRHLSPKEESVLMIAAQMPDQLPTCRQSLAVLKAADRLRSLGLPPHLSAVLPSAETLRRLDCRGA